MEANEEIGLALAGGGLQGFSHIGALKALEELGINVKYISGTSTGSIAASLYAMGFTPTEIEEIWKQEYKKILKFKKRRLSKVAVNYLLHQETRVNGLVDGIIVEELIDKKAKQKRLLKISDFKEKSLAIATVDTVTMKECIFTSMNNLKKDEKINYIQDINIGKAVRASMAFPGIFNVVNYENYSFIDGRNCG